MRILVFSDSHGRVQPMLDAVERCDPDALFHLGDVVRDAQWLRKAHPKLPFYQVMGNCDWGVDGCETEGLARLAGKTVFYLHGHTRHVKMGPSAAVAQARALKADLLLFGHTHSPLRAPYDDLLAVNPGAVMDGRFALLSWESGGTIDCRLLEG